VKTLDFVGNVLGLGVLDTIEPLLVVLVSGDVVKVVIVVRVTVSVNILVVCVIGCDAVEKSVFRNMILENDIFSVSTGNFPK
jgi:hypothetical protein